MDKNKKQALGWLKAASDDLDNIGYIIKVDHLTNIVAFHSQQTIEKSFKALIEYKKISFVKTHNGDMGLLPHGKPTIDDAKQFYVFAKTVFDKVCNILDIDRKEIVR